VLAGHTATKARGDRLGDASEADWPFPVPEWESNTLLIAQDREQYDL